MAPFYSIIGLLIFESEQKSAALGHCSKDLGLFHYDYIENEFRSCTEEWGVVFDNWESGVIMGFYGESSWEVKGERVEVRREKMAHVNLDFGNDREIKCSLVNNKMSKAYL